MPTLGHLEPVSTTNWDDNAIRKVASWLSCCISTHTQCSTTARYMPTRLLDLGDGRGKPIRLVENVQEAEPYVALSYCWGPQPAACLQTLAGNIENHRRAIPMERLPLALAQTVQLCRALGYNLLWIDALCIIQDSPEDWARESSSMGPIYSHAHLVIANEVTDDCRKPLHTNHYFASRECVLSFQYKVRSYVGPSPSTGSWTNRLTGLLSAVLPTWPKTGSNPAPTAYWQPVQRRDHPAPPGTIQVIVRRSPQLMHDMIGNASGPLSSRAWAFQEFLMPRRLLTLTSLEMGWRCYELGDCECGSHLQDRFDKPIASTVLEEMMRLVSTIRDVEPAASSWTRDADMMWRWMVSNYSQRDITQSSDRLVAIAGIAEAFEKILSSQRIQTKYLAGHWEHNLVESLYWRSVPLNNTVDTNAMRRYIDTLHGLPPTQGGGVQPGGKQFQKVLDIMEDEHPYRAGKFGMTTSADTTTGASKAGMLNSRYFPSWSWASSRMPVMWPDFNSVKQGGTSTFFSRIAVLEAVTKVWQGDQRKRIVTGSLTVSGSLIPIRLRSMPVRKPPVYTHRTFSDPRMQGLVEFWNAFGSTLHHALFSNGVACPFDPDSPCLSGSLVPDVYEAWGLDLRNLLLACEKQRGGSHARRSHPQSSQTLPSLFPCGQDRNHILGCIALCKNTRCWCHFGWTEPEDEPFWALKLGVCRTEVPRGNATVSSVFLVLRRVPGSPNSYWRVGCGSFNRFGDDESHPDPFKGAGKQEIIIE